MQIKRLALLLVTTLVSIVAAGTLVGGHSENVEGGRASFGPGGGVSTWLNERRHCMMETKCQDQNITGYPFMVVCKNDKGDRVLHVRTGFFRFRGDVRHTHRMQRVHAC